MLQHCPLWSSLKAEVGDYRSDRLAKNLVAQFVDDAQQRIRAKPFPKIWVLVQTAALSRKSDGSPCHKAFVPMQPSELLSNQVRYYKRNTKRSRLMRLVRNSRCISGRHHKHARFVVERGQVVLPAKNADPVGLAIAQSNVGSVTGDDQLGARRLADDWPDRTAEIPHGVGIWAVRTVHSS